MSNNTTIEPTATRRGPRATQSPTRLQKPWVASAGFSLRKRRSSYGLKTALSSGRHQRWDPSPNKLSGLAEGRSG